MYHNYAPVYIGESLTNLLRYSGCLQQATHKTFRDSTQNVGVDTWYIVALLTY